MTPSNNSVFCPSCGVETAEGKFCSTCGASLPDLSAKVASNPEKTESQPAAAAPAASKEPEAEDSRKWWEKKRFAFPIIGFVVFAVISNVVSPDTGSSDSVDNSDEQVQTNSAPSEPEAAAETPSAEGEAENETAVPQPESESIGPSQGPDEQRQFVSTFQRAIDDYNEASTELQAANALNVRDAELCTITSQGQVDDWIGVVESVGANGDGKGVLAIEIAPDLVLKTWNNAFSDIGDGTLIEPSSELFEKVLPLEGGETVRFSGRFVGGSNHCLKDSRLTDNGRATDPDFIIKFRDVEVVG